LEISAKMRDILDVDREMFIPCREEARRRVSYEHCKDGKITNLTEINAMTVRVYDEYLHEEIILIPNGERIAQE
jgi:hypothetical protein